MPETTGRVAAVVNTATSDETLLYARLLFTPFRRKYKTCLFVCLFLLLFFNGQTLKRIKIPKLWRLGTRSRSCSEIIYIYKNSSNNKTNKTELNDKFKETFS